MRHARNWAWIGLALLVGCASEVGAPPAGGPGPERQAHPSAQPAEGVSVGRTAYYRPEPVYGVVLRDEGERLPVFAHPAGDHGLLAWLPPVSGALTGTGREQTVDGTRFVEIDLPDGSGTGWVQARYLTEWVSPDRFCRAVAEEGHVEEALATLRRALEGDGALADVVSPRGLYLREGDETDAIHVPREELSAAALGPSTAEALRPVLGDGAESHCNRVVAGEATGAPFPTGYINFNFLVLHAEGPQQTTSWAVVFEHVGGRPTLVALERLNSRA